MEKIENYEHNIVENEILSFWKKDNTYKRTKQKNHGKKSFYYLDGPPYTSGKIHIGHAWGKALRDAEMRYKRSQGFDVWDRSGFDMHGLPISHKVEAKLGIKGRDQIEAYGVDKFVEECKKLAIENMNSMIVDFARLGIWMDFENPYKPIDNSYIEGIWWLIKKAHENKRLYEGFRTLTWCPTCESAVAKHELEYEEITDNAIFVKFKIAQTTNEYLIIWTTTPWTIPFNLAVMVNPTVKYIKAKVGNEYWIVAKDLASALIKDNLEKEFEIVEEFLGERIEGMKYIHPLSDMVEFPKAEKTHSVLLSAEHVDTTSGSGLVHCAPGCGPEDYEVGHRNGLPAFNNLNAQGIFENTKTLNGLKAKFDDKKFIEILESKNAILHKGRISHDYPHCWRCHNPIVFRATKQWFFKVEDLKEEMKKLNSNINWVPDWAGNRQFHSWLDNLRDNSITKQIHWGTPFPVWKCESCGSYDVAGSASDLKKLGANEIPKDLHKPYIDKVVLPCKCGGKKVRNPDVLDVWVDAGCSSWLCLDYPVKEELFHKLFPADFILEGKDQIRGWFNLLFVASMISMKKPSFKAVYMHGFINDSMGRKMSKSLGNVISPYEVIEKYGVDTLRYYMIGAANPGMDMNYNFEDMKIKNKNLGILWNISKYLIDACITNEITPTNLDEKKLKLDIEEKYILSKLNTTIKNMTNAFDEYRINETPVIVEELFLELSRTYIQLIREKLATGDDDEKEAVIYAMYKVIFETLKMFTPIAPFITEKIYKNIKSAFGLKEESINDYAWPSYDEKLIDLSLEKDFETAKDALQAVLNAREKANLGVRWPVKEVSVVSEEQKVRESIENLKELLMVQANIKHIKVVKEFEGMEKTLKPNYKTLGKEFGKSSQEIIKNLETVDTKKVLKALDENGYTMKLSDKEVVLQKDHVVVESKINDEFAFSEFKSGQVFLDKIRTPTLDAEGYYREVSRRIQNLRKNAGLHKIDRIKVYIQASISMKQDLEEFKHQLKEKVGADDVRIETFAPQEVYESHAPEKIKEEDVKVYFNKVEN